MAEDLTILENATKKEKYQNLIPQLNGLVSSESNQIANMANIAAALKEALGFFWVGFYLVDTGDELVLGPFQGPVACTRIRKGKGVCGSAWAQGKTIIVPDVEAFPGHIACAAASRSEIVIPIRRNEKIIGVLDVDSTKLNDFDKVDEHYLEQTVLFFA